jgi:hypothetical protein
MWSGKQETRGGFGLDDRSLTSGANGMNTHLAIQQMVAFFFGCLVANFKNGIIAKLDRVVARNADQVVMMVG